MSVAFDHLMVLVADEAVAAQEFSAAGFTVTPRSELPGMANRLICFASGVPHAASFIELLSVERPDAVPAAVRTLIGQTLGPLALVFAVPDLDACRLALAQSGAAVTGPLKIRRQWTLPSGQTLDIALDVAIGEAGALPFKWVIVQHHTVGHYLRSGFTSHTNGCRAIRAVVGSVDDPLREAGTMERMFGCEYRHVGACAIVDLKNVQLLLTPDIAGVRQTSGARPAIAGVILQDGLGEVDLDGLAHTFSQRSRAAAIDSIELGGLRLFQMTKRL